MFARVDSRLRILEDRLRSCGRPDLVDRAVKLVTMARSLLTQAERDRLDARVSDDHLVDLSDEQLAELVLNEDAPALAEGLRAQAAEVTAPQPTHRFWGDS